MLHFCELGPTNPNCGFLRDWAEIWQKRPASRSGLGLRAATVLAHLNANGRLYNNLHLNSPVNTLERYDWFMKSAATGGAFLRDPNKLSNFDLRHVLGALVSNADLEWCQKNYTQNPSSWKSADKIWQFYHSIRYRQRNDKGIHLSAFRAFYENNPQSIEIYSRYGGTCMAQARTGNAYCAAAGVPTFLVTQPNHMAFYWKDTVGNWRRGNEFHGWAWSREYRGVLPWHGTAALAFLYDEFHASLEKSRDSLLLMWLADTIPNFSTRRTELYKAALAKHPLNYEALYALIAMNGSRPLSAENALAFLKGNILAHYAGHPLVVEQILRESIFSSLRTSKNRRLRYDYWGSVISYFSRAQSHPSSDAPTIACLRFLVLEGLVSADLKAPPHTLRERVKTAFATDRRLDARAVTDTLLKTHLLSSNAHGYLCAG